jgi:hypothetical protein
MPFTGKVGDTLRLRDIGARHRYIILTKPNSDGNVVIANFTTAGHFEWLVTFRPRDNRELFKEKSTVNYNDARFYSISALAKVVERNPKEYVFCPENLTKEIVIGALQSKFTPIEILEELKGQYPNEYERYCEKDY